MEGAEEKQNGAQNCMQKDKAPEDDDDFGGDQCDLNLSPEQSRRQIIELLAAMEIDRPERQNSKRYCAYLEKPRQYAQSRSPETQDRIQWRLGCAPEHNQDYLVRAGRRYYNPALGLFPQVLESNIRYHKEERRLEEDPGLQNSEQRVEIIVLQVGRNQRQPFNHIRVAKKMPPHLFFSYNGRSYSYKGMPFEVSTAQRTITKCLQPVIAEARIRCGSRIIVYVDYILLLNQDLLTLQFEIQQVMMIFQEKRGVLKRLRNLMELAKRQKYIRTSDLELPFGEIQFIKVQFKRIALYIKYLQKLKRTKKQPVEDGISGLNSILARQQTQLGGLPSQPATNHYASRNLASDQQSRQILRAQYGGNIDQRESGESICSWRMK
ncbi:MAG: hypothetical protein EZS28_014202 [Streblomastix strix]|uniref:Reverse transcriptase domain-containing protein n=1 Tax=Streblomastix strix TaxID=222440 RepID=A0A5J4W5Q9_9EUKA|nr:MAG: hypothetical protein EZS28_014202 [Streblomastix strix]